MRANAKLVKITESRGEIYGDPFKSHDAIGLAWTGILRNRFQGKNIPIITADLVALMLASFKLVRAARPIYHQDSFDDAHIYTGFGEEFHTGREKE